MFWVIFWNYLKSVTRVGISFQAFRAEYWNHFLQIQSDISVSADLCSDVYYIYYCKAKSHYWYNLLLQGEVPSSFGGVLYIESFIARL